MGKEDHASTILLVEDNLGVARALAQGLSLSEDGNYRVDVCDSGEEALTRLVESPYDLLISDLRLPGLDGLDLLARARQMRPGIRTILITAYGSPEVEARSREVATLYLPKPFHLREVLSHVERVLSQPEAAEPPELAVEGAPEPAGEGTPAVSGHTRYLKIIACDLDGTLIETGKPSPRITPDMYQLLQRAKTAGFVLILVTGRRLDDLMQAGPYAELCEAIVAENGAVVYFPRRDAVRLPFGELDARLIGQLEQQNVPIERGMSIVSTWAPHDMAVLQALRTLRISAAVEYNRGGVMVLPPGASKGAGLLYALREAGYSPRNVIAVGDAENDRSLLEVAELAVAVANAEPAIKEIAHLVLPSPHSQGVASLLDDLTSGKPIQRGLRLDRRLVIGRRSSGTPVHLDPFELFEGTLGIFGASASGKSWLAGLLVEEALRLGYQVVILDPEGDYRGLGASRHVMVLGGRERKPPDIADVISFGEWHGVSMVLDFCGLDLPARTAYLAELLTALQNLRSRRGRPHLLLVDEIQNLSVAVGEELDDLFMEMIEWGGFVAVSYRPGLLPPHLVDRLDSWLLTRLKLSQEVEPFAPVLSRLPHGPEVLEALTTLPRGQAYMVSNPPPGAPLSADRIVRFQVGTRATPHIRHLQKYLHSPLPAAKQFYFRDPAGKTVVQTAANLWEFREALYKVSLESLIFHLERDDFGRWLRDVIHDDELARQIRKVADRDSSGEALRQAILEVVTDRCDELEEL
jgi:hydroxymethylpyrimidine pyrophosphatase-like HAD family hydrolase/ActR/RegA family two-component response regulator